MSLQPDEIERYARHILLKEVGGPGQARLRNASALIVGAGGLGAPAALYLAAAGIGRLALIDHDAVALSNLQRQVIFRTGDVGRAKVDAAADALSELNPDVALEVRLQRLTASDAVGHVAGFDVVLDGTDDFPTRYAVADACFAAGVTLVSGAVGRWDGQLATFKPHLTRGQPADLRLPCYRCFMPEPPQDAETCETVGVMGALTGVIGSMMALEAVKEITGAGESLAGRLMLYDGLSATARTVALPADPGCAGCGER